MGTISISQARYIDEMLETFGLKNCKPLNAPIDVNQKLSKEMCPSIKDEKDEMGKRPYREVIGSLLFISQVTRPIGRFQENPGIAHWQAAKRVLRYLSGAKKLELIYGIGSNQVMGFCDADWASDCETRRSTTEYLFTLNGAAITWNTKSQITVALSTTETEFMSMVNAVQEGMWLKQLLAEIFAKTEANIKIFCDNKGAIQLAKNNAFSPRSKHIDIKHKFIHEKISNAEISIDYPESSEMPADILTKVCPRSKLIKHLPSFGANNIALNDEQ